MSQPTAKAGSTECRSTIQNVCIFCCKSGTNKTDNIVTGNKSVISKFIRFMERYVVDNRTVREQEETSLTLENVKFLDCCTDCGDRINSLCAAHHQLKCLELKLKWNLEKLVNVMKMAVRVPSVASQLQCLLNDFQCDDLVEPKEVILAKFKGFRRNVIRKCTGKLSKSQPRVSVKRCDASAAFPELIPNSCEKKGYKCDGNNDIPPTLAVEIFLGWVMSIAAVALLASVSMNVNSFTIPTNSDDGHKLSSEQSISFLSSSEEEEELDSDTIMRDGQHDSNVTTMPASIRGDGDQKIQTELELVDPVPIICSTKIKEELMDDNQSIESEEHDGTDHVSDEYPGTTTRQKEIDTPPVNQPEERIAVKCENSVQELPQIIKFFTCNFCRRKYSAPNQLKRHLLRYHGGKAEWKFRCQFCQISYESFKELRKHKRTSINHQLMRKICLEKQKQSKLNEPTLLTFQVEHIQPSQIPEQVKRVSAASSYRDMVPDDDDDDDDDDEGMDDNDSDASQHYLSSDESTSSNSDSESSPESKIDIKPSYSNHLKTESEAICSVDNGTCARKRQPQQKRVVCGIGRCKQVVTEPCLEAHQKLHTKGQYKCNFCDCVWKTLFKLIKHERIKHSPPSHNVGGKELLCCPRCDFEYAKNKPAILQKHFVATYISGHGLLTTKQNAKILYKYDDVAEDIEQVVKLAFQCNLCFQKFGSFFALRTHKNTYHSKEDVPGGDVRTLGRKYICPVVHCNKSFRAMKKLEDHKKLHGSFTCQFCDEVKEYAPDLALHECQHAVRSNSSRRIYNCSRCAYSCGTESWYIRHHAEVHLNLNAATDKCQICGMEGNGGHFFLRRHFKQYHFIDDVDPADVQRCDQCSAYFRERKQLCYHKYKIHFSEKCPECGKGFPEWVMLLAHMDKKHPNHKAFPNVLFICGLNSCRQRFATEAELHEHRNDPEHQQEFVCSDCGKGFKGVINFKQHMKMVHVVPTHICPECGKSFKTKLALNTHLEYHKSPDDWKFQCPTCGRKFAAKQKLDQHLRTHTKEKLFICQFCGERYAHRHNWKNHMKTKHKDDYQEPHKDASRKGNFLSRKGTKKGEFIMAKTK